MPSRQKRLNPHDHRDLYNLKISNTTVTDDYTVISSDDIILCSGTITIDLPLAADLTRKIIRIKNIGTGVVTVDPNENELIDGGLTAELECQYESITIVSDSSNWHIV